MEKGLGKPLRAAINNLMAARHWKEKKRGLQVFYKNPYAENVLANMVASTTYDRSYWTVNAFVKITYLDLYEFEKVYFPEHLECFVGKDSPYFTRPHLNDGPTDNLDWYSYDVEKFTEVDIDQLTQVLDAGERVLRELVEKFPTVRSVWDHGRWRMALRDQDIAPPKRDPMTSNVGMAKLALFLGEYDFIDEHIDRAERHEIWRAKFHERPVQPLGPWVQELLDLRERVRRDRAEAVKAAR